MTFPGPAIILSSRGLQSHRLCARGRGGRGRRGKDAVCEGERALPSSGPPSCPHPCGTREALPALMRRSAWSNSSSGTVLRWPSRAGPGGLVAWPRELTCRFVPRAGAGRPAQSSPGKPLLEPPHKDQNKRVTAGWKPDPAGPGATGRCRLQAAPLSTPPGALLCPAGSRGHVSGRGKGPWSAST